jgi:hypothetical protein
MPPRPGPPARFLPALPLPPHFLGCAPLDAWARLLFAPFARIPWRYWPRLGVALAISALITALTLPERLLLAPVLLLRGRAARHTLRHRPGVLVILGYYRSGTTHLHNLLACDRRSQTPRWFEALVPHGFLLSWNFLRFFLLGFLSTKRPQDDMAFGPEWPAEDDFACNNWTVTSGLAGRVALPGKYAHYQRYHFLDGLTPREHARWRATEWAFLWKITRFAGRRRLLLKTPSHTARVRELLDLFGPENVRFIHVTRDAADVVRSNVAMLQRMGTYNLQDPPDADGFLDLIADEYDRTERAFLAQRTLVPPGQLATMRFQDLTADPLRELERVYRELSLPFDDRFRNAAHRYLDSVREYRTAGQKRAHATDDRTAGVAKERLGWMHDAFGHRAPALPKVEPPHLGYSPDQLRRKRARAAAFLPPMVVLLSAAWLLLAIVLNDRSDWMVWPTGIALGLFAKRMARVGSVPLGVAAALATAAALALVSFPATRLVYYRNNPHPSWFDMYDATFKELRSESTLPWIIFGVLTAYKLGSRRSGEVPGT